MPTRKPVSNGKGKRVRRRTLEDALLSLWLAPLPLLL
eukprot:COSAG05_NODE_15574_length_366_cov_0.779026_1_plen_36_part_01